MIGSTGKSKVPTRVQMAAGLAGLGIARTAMIMAAPHLAAGTLQVVMRDWTPAPSPLYAVYPPNRHVSARLRVFIDWTADRSHAH